MSLGERFYTKSHEWVQFDGDEAIVGLTDYAQDALGDLVFINLPNEGEDVSVGDQLADVESVKAVSDVFSPVTGVIKEVNEALLDAPESINESPYEAWIARIENITDKEELLTEDEYNALEKD